MTTTDSAPRGVGAVDTGFALLDILATEGPMTAAGLQARSGLGRGQIHAYLVSLTRAGLVEKDARRLYHVGRFGLELGLAQLLRQDPQVIAIEEVQNTAEAIGQAISICVWGRYGPTVSATIQMNDAIRNSARPGTVFSVTGTATGHLFAALLPAEVTHPVIKAQLTEPEPKRFIGRWPTLDDIAPELQQARARDMAITRSWPQPGVSALAAPVRNFSGEIEAVLTMMGDAAEIDTSDEGVHASTLRALARRVSDRLGHWPPQSQTDEARLSKDVVARGTP